MTSQCPEWLPGDEYTGESQLPSNEYTGESQLHGSEYIGESIPPLVMNTPGSLNSPVVNTLGNLDYL